MGTHYAKTSNVEVHKKARPFNFLIEKVDGNDICKVYEKTKDLVDKIRENKRPGLLECYTYRWMGHSAFDSRPYRDKEEIKAWKEKDPIQRFKKQLLDKYGVNQEEIDNIESMVDSIIREAEEFALNSDYPVYSDLLAE